MSVQQEQHKVLFPNLQFDFGQGLEELGIDLELRPSSCQADAVPCGRLRRLSEPRTIISSPSQAFSTSEKKLVLAWWMAKVFMRLAN